MVSARGYLKPCYIALSATSEYIKLILPLAEII